MQTFTSLRIHIVFGTKRRQPFLTDDVRERAFRYSRGSSMTASVPPSRSAASKTTSIC